MPLITTPLLCHPFPAHDRRLLSYDARLCMHRPCMPAAVVRTPTDFAIVATLPPTTSSAILHNNSIRG